LSGVSTIVFVDLNLLPYKARATVLADELRNTLSLKKGEHLGELVMHGAGRQLLLVAKEDEAKEVLSLDVFGEGFGAALFEVLE
jgi:hypothetical protein